MYCNGRTFEVLRDLAHPWRSKGKDAFLDQKIAGSRQPATC